MVVRLGIAELVQAAHGGLEDGDPAALGGLGSRQDGRDDGLADLGAGAGDEDAPQRALGRALERFGGRLGIGRHRAGDAHLARRLCDLARGAP